MVCGSCSKASGSLKCSRCRMMTYCNRECQAAHWHTHKIHCKRVEMSPQKLQLHFTVGRSGPPITFHENIPAAFCQRDAPRDLTSRWVSQLVDTHEEEVLVRHPGRPCLYCGKPAIKLHTTLAITLHGNPPTVFAMGQPLCTKNRNDGCAVQAQATIDQGLQSPDFPGRGTEIYKA
ncbi:hypothetical protein C8F04DRAFT_259002 [Mycena alexandri]|uniref:MYND-type domain-containing protein n=1 Tax=Mycena alexandri TaxID=1745969 RepID=A0AAD6S5V7_9AGAR|nr:hypothetical protein C8F04DRAFT_259002 [Mycena alexandri]